MVSRLTVPIALLALFALACGGSGSNDGNGNTDSGTVTLTVTPAVTLTPEFTASPVLPPTGEAAVEAVLLYLQSTGFDGQKGDLTDPTDCDAAEAAGAQGEFCIVTEAGHYAPALVILFVTRRETAESWQLHVDLDVERSVWEVTSVDFLGTD